MTRAYELMVIFDGGLDDAAADAATRRVADAIGAKGGRVVNTSRWGKRRFAYEIDHRHEGFYVVYEALTESGSLDDVERQLRLADDVVRHKLIRLPDHEAAKRGLTEQAAPAEAG
jgi:small subunit ribosomal protein S6